MNTVSNSPDQLVLDEASAAIVSAATAGIRAAVRSSIREIGTHLAAAKAVLPHGAFQKWAQAEFDISPRSASRYMQAAAFLEGKSDTVADLPPSVIYELASPKADPALVAEVTAAADDGKPLAEVKLRYIEASMLSVGVTHALRRSPKADPVKLRKRLLAERRESLQQHRSEMERKAAADTLIREEARPLLEDLRGIPRFARLYALMSDWQTARLVLEELARLERGR